MSSKLPTASQLHRVLECVGSAVLPQVDTESTPWQSLGVETHRYLERVNQVGREAALAEVKDEQLREGMALIEVARLPLDPASFAVEVTFAYNVVTGTARELGRSLQRDYSEATPEEEVGTADVVGVTATKVVVVDWKRGHGHLPPPADHVQLRFLALAAARAYRKTGAIVELIRIRDDGTAWRERAELDMFDLAEIAEQVRGLAADVTRWQAADTAPPVRVGSWCVGCPAFRRCRAQVELAIEVAAAPLATTADDREAIVQRFEGLLTLERAPELYGKLKSLDALIELLWTVMKGFAARNPFSVGGNKVYGPKETKHESLDGKTVWHVIKDLYGEDVAWKVVQMTATKSKIEGHAREVAAKTGAKISHVERDILAEVARRGGLAISYDDGVRVHVPKKEGGR